MPIAVQFNPCTYILLVISFYYCFITMCGQPFMVVQPPGSLLSLQATFSLWARYTQPPGFTTLWIVQLLPVCMRVFSSKFCRYLFIQPSGYIQPPGSLLFGRPFVVALRPSGSLIFHLIGEPSAQLILLTPSECSYVVSMASSSVLAGCSYKASPCVFSLHASGNHAKHDSVQRCMLASLQSYIRLDVLLFAR